MLITFYDASRILNKVYSEGAYLKQAVNSVLIDENRRALTVKTCYGVLDRDLELSYYVSELSGKNPKLAVRTVLKIAMYHIKYLQKHAYAVIDNAVELVKKLGKGGVSGFVNAVLRKFAAAPPQLPDGGVRGLSYKYSFPEFAVKRLIADYGQERAECIMSAQGGKTTLVFYRADGAEYLTARDIKFEKTPFDNVFTLENFSRNEDYDSGLYTFQNICSAAICSAVEGGGRLLDACAAPGGKSVNLSRKFTEVVALDLHAHRAELIRSYAARMGADNITVGVANAEEFIEEYKLGFDAVLCDVPCSGYGVAFENPDIKLNRDEKSVAELCRLQRKILDNCSQYVKVGGKLYYSTCSLFSDENEKNADIFLAEHPDFCAVQLCMPLAHEKRGVGVQFLPDISGGGFYLAAFTRVK